MPTKRDKESYEYAERIRAGLPRLLQSLREAVPVSKYGLQQRCGISRQMITQIETGESIPTVYVLAKICPALGLRLGDLMRQLDQEANGAEGRQQ